MGVRSRGWAVVSAAGGNVLIGCDAFWLSFTALADLAHRSGIAPDRSWAWPLLVDGLIVVATIAAVALDRRPAAWYAWTLLIAGALVSVTANALHAIVAADASVPGMLAAAVAAVPPLVLLASTHLTVVLIRSTKTVPAADPVRVPVVELEPAPPSVSGAVGAGEPGEGAPELLPVPQDEGGDRREAARHGPWIRGAAPDCECPTREIRCARATSRSSRSAAGTGSRP